MATLTKEKPKDRRKRSKPKKLTPPDCFEDSQERFKFEATNGAVAEAKHGSAVCGTSLVLSEIDGSTHLHIKPSETTKAVDPGSYAQLPCEIASPETVLKSTGVEETEKSFVEQISSPQTSTPLQTIPKHILCDESQESPITLSNLNDISLGDNCQTFSDTQSDYVHVSSDNSSFEMLSNLNSDAHSTCGATGSTEDAVSNATALTQDAVSKLYPNLSPNELGQLISAENLHKLIESMSLGEDMESVPSAPEAPLVGGHQLASDQDKQEKGHKKDVQMATEHVQKLVAGVKRGKMIAGMQEESCVARARALFGERDFAEVRRLSARAERLLATPAPPAPASRPHQPRHPHIHALHEMLQLYTKSVLEEERNRESVARLLHEEERARHVLWQLKQLQQVAHGRCKCGSKAKISCMYQWGRLQGGSEALAVARARLAALRHDALTCHALTAHTVALSNLMIEESVRVSIASSEPSVEGREGVVGAEGEEGEESEEEEHLERVLACVASEMRALRMAAAPESTGARGAERALLRWAQALASHLMGGALPALRAQVLLVRLLLRMEASVAWGVDVLRVRAPSVYHAARVLALLDLMVTHARHHRPQEGEEEGEGFVEVEACAAQGGGQGGGQEAGQAESVVVGGACSERELLALVQQLPWPHFLAALTLCRNDPSLLKDMEGDGSGGCGMVKAVCGGRALADIVRAAAGALPQYTRLLAYLTALALHTLVALTALHDVSKKQYKEQLGRHVQKEVEALFLAVWRLVRDGAPHLLPALPFHALSDHFAWFFYRLCTKRDTPERRGAVGWRLQCLAVLAAQRPDTDLAFYAATFLVTTGFKREPGGALSEESGAARRALATLLSAHPDIYPVALDIISSYHSVWAIEESSVGEIGLRAWRPGAALAAAQLARFMQRAPALAPALLAGLDYTPGSGLRREAQVALGEVLVRAGGQYARAATPAPASAPAWLWERLVALPLHPRHWARHLPHLQLPEPESEPEDPFQCYWAVVNSQWGCSVPLVCQRGCGVVVRLARARPLEAARCLADLVLVMTASPESIPLTPQFREALEVLVAPEGGMGALASRLLGLDTAPSPIRALHDHITSHLFHDYKQVGHAEPRLLLESWLRLLLMPQDLSNTQKLIEHALECCQGFPDAMEGALGVFCEHVEREATELGSGGATGGAGWAVWGGGGGGRGVLGCDWSRAPYAAVCALAAQHRALERRPGVWARLLAGLGARPPPSVEQAWCGAGGAGGSGQLVVYRAVSAALAAPVHHPAHAHLWQLVYHLYLQRTSVGPGAAPVGPLLFRGLVNALLVGGVRRRLDEAAHHHAHLASRIDALLDRLAPADTADTTAPPVPPPTVCLQEAHEAYGLPAVGAGAGAGASAVQGARDPLQGAARAHEVVVASSMRLYHQTLAKKMSEYRAWLSEEACRDVPPARAHITDDNGHSVLDIAWRVQFRAQLDPAPTPAPAPSPPAAPFVPVPPLDRLQSVVQHYPFPRHARHKLQAAPLVEPAALGSPRALLASFDRLLRRLVALADELKSAGSEVEALDAEVVELCGRLYRQRVTQRRETLVCTNDQCRDTITLTLQCEECVEDETVAAQVRSNRERARQLLHALMQPSPELARTAAELLAHARAIEEPEVGRGAFEALMAAWDARAVDTCVPLADTLHSLAKLIGERWIWSEEACAALEEVELGAERGAWAGAALWAGRLVAGGVLQPHALPPAAQLRLYRALLQPAAPAPTSATAAATAPPDDTFALLSKFKMEELCAGLGGAQRLQLFTLMVQQLRSEGPAPPPHCDLLHELLHVQMVAVPGPEETASALRVLTAAAVARRLPPASLALAVTLLARHRTAITPLQVRKMVMMQESVWRGAGHETRQTYAEGGLAVAAVLTLALAHAYGTMDPPADPHHVGEAVWEVCSRLWRVWVAGGPPPHAPPPPSVVKAHAATLHRTVAELLDICPGGACPLLRGVFIWTCEVLSAWRPQQQQQQPQQPGAGAERAHLLMTTLVALPFPHHRWFNVTALPALVSLMEGDEEERMWGAVVTRSVRGRGWVEGAVEGGEGGAVDAEGGEPEGVWTASCALGMVLAALTALPYPADTLLDATKFVSWEQLHTDHLDHALDSYWQRNHSPLKPIHTRPDFQVVCAAASMGRGAAVLGESGAWAGRCEAARRSLMARWLRSLAALAPPAAADAAAHLLRLVSDTIVGYRHPPTLVGRRETEAVCMQLVGDAILMLHVPPHHHTLLPVWCEWVGGGCGGAAVVAAGVLRVAPHLPVRSHAHALADAAVQALLLLHHDDGWALVSGAWEGDATWWQVVCEGAGHEEGGGGGGGVGVPAWCAYAAARLTPAPPAAPAAPAAPPPGLLHALAILHEARINFSEQERGVALVALVVAECGVSAARDGAGGEGGEGAVAVVAAAARVLRGWALEPRYPLLRALTLQPQPNAPAPRLRALCRFLLWCVLSASAGRAGAASAGPAQTAERGALLEAAGRALAAAGPADACAGAAELLATAPAAARPLHLAPRLAAALYPRHDHIFAPPPLPPPPPHAPAPPPAPAPLQKQKDKSGSAARSAAGAARAQAPSSVGAAGSAPRAPATPSSPAPAPGPSAPSS